VSGSALLYCAGGGIGDSLMASVVARALHRRFGRVDALTLPGHREALARVPDLDGVLVDDGGDEAALAGTVASHGYDASVVTWATARTARVPELARIPLRVGQARRLYSHRFTKRVTVRSERGDVLSHWSDVLLDYARAIGCDSDDRAYHFVPTAQDEEEAEALLRTLLTPSLSKGGSNHGFMILNPCNAIASKRGVWPVEGWAALSNALHERFGIPVLVTGSPADAPIAEALVDVAAAQGGLREIESIAGKSGIGAFGALAKRARAFVGITTGSMHVAAAVGCPTVGIFPFQSDFPERWAPLGKHVAVVRPTYRCHPGDTKESCRDYACIASLDVPRIVASTESLLAVT
jgi:ADP-heptose:LPS heptosyltransferase